MLGLSDLRVPESLVTRNWRVLIPRTLGTITFFQNHDWMAVNESSFSDQPYIGRYSFESRLESLRGVCCPLPRRPEYQHLGIPAPGMAAIERSPTIV
jgi:hypothetical protein